MRRLAIPDAAEMLSLHPSEVRALIEDGRLDAVRRGGRWMVSVDSVERLTEGPAPDADLSRLEARVAELERRLDSVEGARRAADEKQGGLRPALEPLFRTTD